MQTLVSFVGNDSTREANSGDRNLGRASRAGRDHMLVSCPGNWTGEKG